MSYVLTYYLSGKIVCLKEAYMYRIERVLMMVYDTQNYWGFRACNTFN
jgi:hypothetical protein